MSTGHFKHDLFNPFARVAKAKGNGHWLEMPEFLDKGGVEALV